jgi:hypothetical protein
MNDSQLDDRIAALVARAPAGGPPALMAPRRPARIVRRGLIGAAAVLVLAAATASAGAVIVGALAHGSPGVENAGQPLAGANLECMAPPQAAAYLASHGFGNVIWQVESGGTNGKDGTSVQQANAPAHGYVVPGTLIDGVVYMVVDQRPGAQGVGACFGMPRP